MIKLVLNSASNFTKELLDKYDISYLRCEVVYKDINYPSSLTWEHFSKEDLIDYIKKGGLVTVAHPPFGKWVNELNELLKEDRDIVCILTSSSLSGSCRAFNIVKNLIKTDRHLDFIEVHGSGPCEELFALELINFIKEDTTFEEIKKLSDNMNSRLHYYAISESMRQWAYSGRSNDKKSELVYPEGYPIMKGLPDGHIVPLGLCKSFEEALDKFKEEIKGLKADKCVINYTYDTYPDWISKFEKVVTDTLGCKVLAKNEHGPTVTCVEGVNSVDVAFI